MMQLITELDNFVLDATDGQIGHIKDIYFDDRLWVIRYLVIEIGNATESHKVLLSPAVIKHLNRDSKSITVDLSISEIESSPRIDTGYSRSSHYEIDYLSYYGYAFYWGNNLQSSLPNPDEAGVIPDEVATKVREENEEIFIAIDSVRRMYGDRHLRSCREINHYHIEASDGEIGHLETLLVDDDTWSIQCCVANTSNWWFGHDVLITPQVIRDISWGGGKIYVDMTQQQIKDAPPFDPLTIQNSQVSSGVYLHRGRGSLLTLKQTLKSLISSSN